MDYQVVKKETNHAISIAKLSYNLHITAIEIIQKLFY